MESPEGAYTPTESGEDGCVVHPEDHVGVEELLTASPGEAQDCGDGLSPVDLLIVDKRLCNRGPNGWHYGGNAVGSGIHVQVDRHRPVRDTL